MSRKVISVSQIDELSIEKIHEEFLGYYENEKYFFMGAMDIYVPYLRVQTEVSFLTHGSLNTVEYTLCQLIENGTNQLEDISFLLGINEKMIEGAIGGLIKYELIEERQKSYSFTKKGSLLCKNKKKLVLEKENRQLMLNLSTGEVDESDIECFEKEVNENYVKLSPRITIKADNDYVRSNLLPQVQKLYSDDIQVEDLYLQDRSKVYKKYHLMLYRRENQAFLKFLVYDYDKKRMNASVNQVLYDMYEKNDLRPLRDALEQAQDGIVYLSEYEKKYRVRPAKIKYLMNKEIRELIRNIFIYAKKSVYIISPWISNNEYVMSEKFKQQMEQALKNNVKITIGYGYKQEEYVKRLTEQFLSGQLDVKDELYIKNKKEIETECAARQLMRRFASYSNFRMIFRNTHEKVLCYDEQYSLVGSFNYFSYDGGESNQYTGYSFRKEGAAFVDDCDFAKDLQKTLFH